MKTKCPKTGKICYRDKVSALFALSQTRRSSLKNGSRMECMVYLCPFCHQYHLTSKKNKEEHEVSDTDD